jgi:hypothetical protein
VEAAAYVSMAGRRIQECRGSGICEHGRQKENARSVEATVYVSIAGGRGTARRWRQRYM